MKNHNLFKYVMLCLAVFTVLLSACSPRPGQTDDGQLNVTVSIVPQKYFVERIGGERSFRRRLMEMGLLPGTPIRVVRRGSLEGLVEVEVRGCHLTLRASEAQALFLA